MKKPTLPEIALIAAILFFFAVCIMYPYDPEPVKLKTGVVKVYTKSGPHGL